MIYSPIEEPTFIVPNVIEEDAIVQAQPGSLGSLAPVPPAPLTPTLGLQDGSEFGLQGDGGLGLQ